MDKDYIWENIRALLTKGFTDEELRRFCHDEPAFQPVYYHLPQHISTTEIIDRIIGHAERHLKVEILLNWAQKYNPARYKKHQPYIYTSGSEEWIKVPLRGYIAAGKPIIFFDDAYDGETYIKLPRRLIPTSGLVYALKVKGVSMIDALVDDGDVIIVDESKSFDPNGKMVVLRLIDQEGVTLKLFYLEDNQIRLQPRNRKMKPIYVNDLDNVEIQGQVIAIIPENQSQELVLFNVSS